MVKSTFWLKVSARMCWRCLKIWREIVKKKWLKGFPAWLLGGLRWLCSEPALQCCVFHLAYHPNPNTLHLPLYRQTHFKVPQITHYIFSSLHQYLLSLPLFSPFTISHFSSWLSHSLASSIISYSPYVYRCLLTQAHICCFSTMYLPLDPLLLSLKHPPMICTPSS